MTALGASFLHPLSSSLIFLLEKKKERKKKKTISKTSPATVKKEIAR